ncbi:MAG: CpsD/CapB family tyrosine-protein kinase [Gammaproteobacteria bacterium]|nr:CpsD/CapB family tyrosine-protein kinase [Gammaproteobacteria bacterium]
MERIKQAVEKARKERRITQPQEKVVSITDSRPTGREIIKYTETRIVNVSPNMWKKNRISLGDTTDEISTSYKMLRTQVLQKFKQQGWNSLGISSVSVGEGKSLSAVNLAINMAREINHTVLLVDLDLRKPSIHRYFGYEPEYGLGDYLLNDVPLNKILFNPGIERLVVLPGNRSFIDSSELLSSPVITNMVEDLKSRYPSRIIIFDLPPILACDDAIAFSPYIDSTLLVIEEGKTKQGDLLNALDVLDQSKILGTVLNKSVEVNSAY